MDNKYNILVVEDDYLQSYTLKILFESLNYNVLGTAATGEEAIKMTTKCKPDLILMDITLKGEMDGIEATKIIQKTSDIPIIYVTGNSSDFYRNKAEETNYQEYLIKPVTKQMLTKLLEKHLV